MTTEWSKKHHRYSKEEWINLPSIFSEEAIAYLPETGKILELGAGQGQDSRFFASKGYNVISTDIEADALELNRKKSAGINSITFEQLDISKTLPYPDESLDVVYAHLSLHYFDEATTGKVFGEIYRVLKSGGVLAAQVNSESDPEFNTGKKLEDGYFKTDGMSKRYFSLDSINKYVVDFDTILLDDKGETYKDSAKGVHNLIRFIGKKK